MRAQLKQLRRYVIVDSLIVRALLTLPDVVSQCMLAVPIWLLYEARVLASAVLARRADADAARANHFKGQ